MQILILSSKFPYPLKDGGAIATYNITKGMSLHFEKTHLLSFNTKKHFIKKENIPSELFKNVLIDNIYLNTDVKIIKALKNIFFSRKPYILERFSSKNFKNKLINILKTNTYDIVQIEGLYLMQYAKTIKKFSNSLISYRAHNIEHEIWKSLYKNNKNILFKTYLKILTNRILKYEKSIINKYDILLPISKNDEKKFIDLANIKPLQTIPVGFEKNEEIILKKADKFSLYFIGSLEWLPNTEGIIWFLENCWNLLLKKFPDIKLYIAGRNASEDFIKKIKYKNVIFEGEIENVSDFIAEKQIMIVPLKSGSGMRVKIIEAFMHKKAVVSTNKGSLGTKAEHNKNLLNANNPSEFVNQISLLIENEDFYNKIIDNAYSLFLKKFDNFEISKTLFEFYKHQVKNKK
ncbi:MAG: glycosyltransferase family 4 protein [Bacteroidales bacterium]|nr:glycosyltransferase family 4 protein [Bacteroidales bacterium]MBN2757529.1 glycosyltransferase family 4 protein [Bacteroidales bacterium]